jgi:hypothetical protein
VRRRRAAPVGLAVLVLVCGGAVARANNLRHAYRTSPGLLGLGVAVTPAFQNTTDTILEQAARNLPIPSSSSGFTFRYDAATESYQRSTETFAAPFFTERADTVGKGIWSVDYGFQWIDYDEYDGKKLGKDPYPLSVSQAAIPFSATPELRYTLATLNITYGIRDDLDVNVAIPVAGLDSEVVARRSAPNGATVASATSESFDTVGIADMLVRVKYRLFEKGGFTGAVGGIARLPTGSPQDGLGTGYGELGPYGVLSTTFLHGLIDSHWEAGFDANLSIADHASGHYAWAMDLQPCAWMSLAVELRGRSEVAGWRAESSVSGPHVTPSGIRSLPYLGVDATRKDYFDTTLGVRIRLWRTVLLSAGVSTPINDGGVRASGWSPLGSLEATF